MKQKPKKVETLADSMMRQYRANKAQHPDMLLLFRVGDFYEAFAADAETLAKAIGLTLTRRGDVAMAGFPHHQLEIYLHKLIREKHRVAICDRLEEVPELAKADRLVGPAKGGAA